MVNNPNIRFAGFSDEWIQRKLGEITQIKTGSSDLQDAVVDGEYPFFVRSDIIEKSNRYIFDGEAILIPGEGRIGEIYHYINDKFDFHQRVYKISGFSESDTYGKYVLYYMQKMFKRHAMKFTVKATVDSLRLPILSKFDITTPTLKEQQKIGSIFSTLDHKIGLEERQISLLKDLKKGYLQKLFPKQGAIEPEIRFKGFTDAWEERKLGQYTKLITKGTTPKDKTGIGDVNFVKVENITNGKIYPINKIKQNEHDNYLKRSRLEEKDILFSIAGTLGRTAIVNKSILPANTNQALAIIRGYDFDTNFLITSLSGNVVKEYIRRNPTVGAQPNLSLEQVCNLLVNTPNAEEQQKIGSFFKQLDNTIAHHQGKLNLLKDLKNGLSQQMFV